MHSTTPDGHLARKRPSSSGNADVISQPEVRATGVDLSRPGAQLCQGHTLGLLNRPARVPGLDLVVGLALGRDAGHLGLGACGGGHRGGGGGRLERGHGARNADADVVGGPHARASCRVYVSRVRTRSLKVTSWTPSGEKAWRRKGGVVGRVCMPVEDSPVPTAGFHL